MHAKQVRPKTPAVDFLTYRSNATPRRWTWRCSRQRPSGRGRQPNPSLPLRHAAASGSGSGAGAGAGADATEPDEVAAPRSTMLDEVAEAGAEEPDEG